MVPLADIFNHKAAIVQLSDEYIIEPTCYEQNDSSEDDNSLASGQPSSNHSDSFIWDPDCYYHARHCDLDNLRVSRCRGIWR